MTMKMKDDRIKGQRQTRAELKTKTKRDEDREEKAQRINRTSLL